MSRFTRVVSALAITALVLPAAAAAQGATVQGRIVDKHSRQPISDAAMVHFQSGRTVRSDSAGGYRLDGLPAGLVRFTVKAKGYNSHSFTVALGAGEVMDRLVELDTAAGAGAQPLARVRVEERNDRAQGHRFDDFERRRAAGRGHFLTDADLHQSGASTLNDALRLVHGLEIDCAGFTCAPRSVRSAPGCVPTYWMDGHEETTFTPNTPIRDIQGVEVYLGASDTPGEFAGSNAACGTIVIWTRAAPRKSP